MTFLSDLSIEAVRWVVKLTARLVWQRHKDGNFTKLIIPKYIIKSHLAF